MFFRDAPCGLRSSELHQQTADLQRRQFLMAQPSSAKPNASHHAVLAGFLG
jgi:hypothetical protein